jgi:Yip1-like protein
MAGASLGSITPFLTIWMRPRATIRKIVDSDPTRHVLLLAGTVYVSATLLAQRWWRIVPQKNLQPRNYFLSGLFVQWLVALYDPTGVWPSWKAEIITLVALGAVFGIVWLYFCGAILKLTGRLFGGGATAIEVRAAIAWGEIPWIPAFVCGSLWSNDANSSGTQAAMPYPFVFYAVFFIWGLVALIKCASEVHRVSAWRGLGAVVLWLWSVPLILFTIALASYWLAFGIHALVMS